MATTSKKNTATNTVTVEMIAEKETKGTWRFKEEVESEFVAPKIGTLYVPKTTLGELEFKKGDMLVMTLSVK